MREMADLSALGRGTIHHSLLRRLKSEADVTIIPAYVDRWGGQKKNKSRYHGHWQPSIDTLAWGHTGHSLATLVSNNNTRAREIRLWRCTDPFLEQIRRQVRWRVIHEAERLWESDYAILQYRKQTWPMPRSEAAPVVRIRDHLFAPEALYDDPTELKMEPRHGSKWLTDPVNGKLSRRQRARSDVSDEWVTSTALNMLSQLHSWYDINLGYSRRCQQGVLLPSVTTFIEARKQWHLARMKFWLDSGAIANMDTGANLNWNLVKGVREGLGLPRECRGDDGRVGQKDKGLLEAFNKIITSVCTYSLHGPELCWNRKPFERGGYEGLIDHFAKRHSFSFWTEEIAFSHK